MKVIHLVAAIALAIGLAACSKQETQTPAPTAPPAAPQPAEMPKAAVPAAPAVAADISAQVQGLITKVKDLIAQKDYAGALSALKELSAMKLTPEQQKLVDDLKAQVQKAMAGAAASDAQKNASDAVGGLLGK